MQGSQGGRAVAGRVLARPQGVAALESREERRLAGMASAILYLTAALSALLYLTLPGRIVSSPLLLAGVAAAGLLWSAACLTIVPWERGPAWLPHVGTAAALPLIGLAMAGSGDTDSPARFFLMLIIVFAAYFFPAREALAYLAGSALVLLSPLAYTDAMGTGSYVPETVLLLIVFAATGVSILRGRQIQRTLGARARGLAEEQAALRHVATAVAGGSPPGGIYTLVSSELARLLRGDGAAVLKFDRADSALLLGVWTGAGPGMEPGSRLPLAVGAPLTQVHETGRALLVGDLQAQPVPTAAGAMGYRSQLFVPVVVRGAHWGTLVVVAQQADRWDARALDRTTAFAELLSASISETEDRAALADRAAIDPLTALPNHRAFQARLRDEVCRARRHGRALSLALIDVDHFRQVNRVLGHDGGDDVLRRVAQRLQLVLRAEDVLARTGGDEFAVLLPEADRHQAYLVLERARVLIAEETVPDGAHLTISVGICDLAIAPEPDAMYRLAHGALYWSKVQGRDVTWIYDPDVVRALSAQERAEHLERSQALAGLRALARAIDAKDPSTAQHSERVAAIVGRLAEAAGWSADRVAQLHEAALVHDVGKIGVPDAILLKPGRLDAQEYEVVKEHAELGARIVSEVMSSEQVRWVRYHHERPDGRGYPTGLRGDAIPEGAALMAMADAFDVMTSARSYSAPMALEEAMEECRRLAGAQFTAAAVAAMEVVHARGLLDETADQAAELSSLR